MAAPESFAASGSEALAQGKVVADNSAEPAKAAPAQPLVVAAGPAGTGKTFLAIARAVEALEEGKVGRIILSRPAIEAGESLGYLPGTLEDKLAPYLRPLYDALSDRMKAYLEGATAVHDIAGTVQRILRERSSGQQAPKGSRTKAEMQNRDDAAPRAPNAVPASFPRATHPVVRTHPRTGRKSLFVNPAFT